MLLVEIFVNHNVSVFICINSVFALFVNMYSVHPNVHPVAVLLADIHTVLK